MTSQSPRIYLYKITFEEVSYYYYGVHKEQKYNEEYWGSPKTNKWCWELYTPKKQILQFFDFTDEGWFNALEIEKRLIRPVFNTDKWCLNESCGGIISLKVCRETGKRRYEEKTGMFSLTMEEKSELGKRNGKNSHENKKGYHGRTKEQMIEDGRIGGKISYELGLGIHSLSFEEKSELGRKNGNRNKELGLGIHGITKEKRIEYSKKGGKIGGNRAKELGIGIHAFTPQQKSEVAKKTNSQKWMCLETGYITTSGPLTKYQRARGIDTTKRVRIS
jgi:hypothetical protein